MQRAWNRHGLSTIDTQIDVQKGWDDIVLVVVRETSMNERSTCDVECQGETKWDVKEQRGKKKLVQNLPEAKMR